MPAGGELAAKLARARQRSQDYDNDASPTPIVSSSLSRSPPKEASSLAVTKPEPPVAKPAASTTSLPIPPSSPIVGDSDVSNLESFSQTPPAPPSSFAASPGALQKENKKLLELLKEKDAEIRDLKKKLAVALAKEDPAAGGRKRGVSTTDRFNKVLNDRLSVMGLNTSASSLQISDFVEDEEEGGEGGEGGEEDDGNIFKGVGRKKAPNQSTLFDDDDDDDVYEYGAQGKYIQQINNSEQINSFTKKTSSGGVVDEGEVGAGEEQQVRTRSEAKI